MNNASIRAAAAFCDENTLVKVSRNNPKHDRFETTFVPFKDIRKSDSVSVFSDGHELHFSVLTNASFEKDERYGNECGWSVKVTEDAGKTVLILHPAELPSSDIWHGSTSHLIGRSLLASNSFRMMLSGATVK